MITDIHLQNFRSYSDESFELSPNVNIIVGPNASGKTNLLESLLIIARGGSYRAHDAELIKFGETWARIESNLENSNRIVMLEPSQDDKIIKTFEINTKKAKWLNLSQTLPIILFEPNHLLLLIGSPEIRRGFIDDILEQTKVGYRALKNQYKRSLSQRNVLLKQTSPTNQELFVWNVRLSELGGKIFKSRTELISKLNENVSRLYDSFSADKDKIELIYKSKNNTENYETNLLKKLEQTIDVDMVRGFTGYGPHRDDIEVLINGKVAAEVASRGETRTIILSLKVIETKIVEEAREQKPILLFDDVFSELDGSRRLALTKNLIGYQTVITTTDADIVVQHFMGTNNIIPLS